MDSRSFAASPPGSVAAMATTDETEAVESATAARPSFIRHLWRHGRARLGLGLLAGMILLALLGPLLAPHDPLAQHLLLRLKGPVFQDPQAGLFVLGTDQFGRDELSRLLYGARLPLFDAFAAAPLGASVGLLVGVVAGFLGGWVDTAVSMLIEVQLSLPFILIALTVFSLFPPSPLTIVIVFALVSWAINGRVARAATLTLRDAAFVEAARALGVGKWRIVWRHIIPNAVSPVLVIATVQISQVIIYEAAFAFFGLGIAPPEPTWGNMLADARNYLTLAPWMGIGPGLCIMAVALGANLLGDALRDVLDPREIMA